MTPQRSLYLNKIVVLLSGVVSTGIAFSAGPLGGIVRAAIGLLGATIGPVLGVYLLGIFSRRCSTLAVTVSFLLTLAFCIFLWVSSVMKNPYKHRHLPSNSTLESCGSVSFAKIAKSAAYDAHYGDPSASYASRISSFAYAFIGVAMTYALGEMLSFVFEAESEKYSIGRKYSLTFRGRTPKPVLETSDQSRGMLIVDKDAFLE